MPLFDLKLLILLLFNSKWWACYLFIQKCRRCRFDSKLSYSPLFDLKLTNLLLFRSTVASSPLFDQKILALPLLFKAVKFATFWFKTVDHTTFSSKSGILAIRFHWKNVGFAAFILNCLIHHFLIRNCLVCHVLIRNCRACHFLNKKCQLCHSYLKLSSLQLFNLKQSRLLLFHWKVTISLLFNSKCSLCHFHSKLSSLPFFDLKLSSLLLFQSNWSRSSRAEVSCKIGVLKNFEKFAGKNLCQGLFQNCRVWIGRYKLRLSYRVKQVDIREPTDNNQWIFMNWFYPIKALIFIRDFFVFS